jgi:hypothetical protein
MKPESSSSKLRPALVRLTDAGFSSLLFRRIGVTDSRYALAYGPAYEESEVNGPMKLCGIVNESCEDRWFIFYVGDCYFPPMYAVSGRSFEDAHEEFICECEHLVKIEDADLEDYKVKDEQEYDDCVTWNANGTPCDTESVHGFEVQLVEAKR